MPSRRELLRLGGATLTAASAAGIAGCSEEAFEGPADEITGEDLALPGDRAVPAEDPDGDDPPEDTVDETETEPTPDEDESELSDDEIAAAFETAVEALSTNDEALADHDAAAAPEELDVAAVNERADTAEAALEDIEPHVAGDDADDVEALQAVATYQRYVAGYETARTELLVRLDIIEAYVAIGEPENAAAELPSALDYHDEVEPELTAAERAAEHLQPVGRSETLGDGGHLDGERQTFERLGTTLEAADEFLAGAVSMREGLRAFDEERYEDALTAFSAASPSLAASERTFDQLETDEETPQRLRTNVIELRCTAGAFAEAATHFEAAASLATAGERWEAEDRFEDGEAALDQC